MQEDTESTELAEPIGNFYGHFDESNPLSLFSKMGKEWADKFWKALVDAKLFIDLIGNETLLKFKLADAGWRPNVTDNRYRFQLWFEYENSLAQRRPMNMVNVYSLVGNPSTFKNLVMQDPRRVVWLLCKPVGYDVQTKEMLFAGLDRMRDVLDRDPFDTEDGKPNTKILELQFKITQWMDLRHHGAPTQKIQAAHVHASVSPTGELMEMGSKRDAEAYRKSIENLRERKAAAQGRGVPLAQPEPAPAIERAPVEVEVLVDAIRKRE